MIIKIDELKLLSTEYQAPVVTGIVWRSLALSPYSLFTRASLDRIVRKYFEHELNNDEPYVALLNIRLEVYGLHRCKMPERTIVLGAASVRAALESKTCLAIVPMVITLKPKALEARLVRSPTLPLGGAQLLGFVPTTSVGSSEQDDNAVPLTANESAREKRRRAFALLNSQIEGGGSIFHELDYSNKIQVNTLLEEMTQRVKRAPALEELIVVRPAQPPPDDDDEAANLNLSDTEGSEVLPEPVRPVARPRRDEVLDAEVDALNDCGTRFQQLAVPLSNDVAVIRRAIVEGQCVISMREHVLCSPDKLISRARHVRAPVMSFNPLWKSLFEKDDETEFYIVRVFQLTDKDDDNDDDDVEIIETAPVPVSTAAVLSPPTRNPTPAVSISDDSTWLSTLATIDLATVHLYELETYARSRLKVLLILLRASEAPPRDRAVMLAHRSVTGYPACSGATRDILALLGGAAKRREQLHPTLGIVVLALTARDDPELRESLLMLELLYVEHYGSARTVLNSDDDSSDDAEHEKRMTQCCSLLEKFWSRSKTVDHDSLLGQRMARLAVLWKREISEFVARQK